MAVPRTRPVPSARAAPPAASLDSRVVVALLLLLAATRACYAWLLPFATEDAYIAFRFADHLAAGEGLVFNPG